MASRFTLVNRGYDVQKAGPSSVNKLLRPPRRVGEIAEVDLRDQKNALGPAAKVKLKPKQPERDEPIPMESAPPYDPVFRTGEQLEEDATPGFLSKYGARLGESDWNVAQVLQYTSVGNLVFGMIAKGAESRRKSAQREVNRRKQAVEMRRGDTPPEFALTTSVASVTEMVDKTRQEKQEAQHRLLNTRAYDEHYGTMEDDHNGGVNFGGGRSDHGQAEGLDDF